MAAQIVVGLAGNPNSGKTTVFNELTGARQHVGNYPGVTVEKKEGRRRHRGHDILFVDLPGTYSLTAYSVEELIARNFVCEERPDVILNVVDASNLERNLYLTTQFMELEQPTVVALNMMDVAEHSGKTIDHELLGRLFGVSMVPTAAAKHKGMEELLDAVVQVAQEKPRPQVHVNFGAELEPHIEQIMELVTGHGLLSAYEPRWLAIKLLEGDVEVRALVQREGEAAAEVLEAVDAARAHIEQVVGDDAEIAVADRRYGFVSGAVRQAMQHDQLHRVDWSDAVDRVVVSRLLGLPIFVMFMWVMFELVFRLGAPPMEWIETLFVVLGEQVRAATSPGELQSLLVDGIISGVGGVLVFVPNIILLFIAISILEDSGYMARAAFVVDRVMHHVGLHGKSFIPMLIGFGCNVPAIVATRTLDQRRDRIVTMLITPLMSCGARLPIYVLLAGAFFHPAVAGKVIFSLYALGVLLAMLMALLFRSWLLRGPTTPFVMELPPYRLPTVKGVAIHVWERAWQYIRKAGTVILAFAIVMWALMAYPKLPAEYTVGLSPLDARAAELQHSIAGRVGGAIEPVLRPLGFDWKMTVALIAGFGAKEVVISTLGTAYSLEGVDETETAGLQAALRADPRLSPLVAYTLMVFVLIYVPCMATIAVIWRESGSWKWPLFTIFYTCALAWVVAFAVYQAGRLLGYG